MNTWKLSEEEKENAIRSIIKQGIVTPKSRIKGIIDICKSCTFSVLFFGIGDCVFLSILITLCLWLFFLEAGKKTILCTVFTLSPFVYLMSFSLTTWKEKILQLYEITMSCRYTIRQVTALRMIYFSIGNMLINTVVLAIVSRNEFAAFWKMLGLSFSSLFLYGMIMLVFQIKGRVYLSVGVPPVMWGLFNLLFSLFYEEQAEGFFLTMTNGIIWLFTIILFIGFIFMLYSFSTLRQGGEKQYAVD